MPLPLGAGDIMFSGCPSIHLSVRSLIYISDQPWPFCVMSVHQSIRPSVRLSLWRGFQAFSGERVERMAWSLACRCILFAYVLQLDLWKFALLISFFLPQLRCKQNFNLLAVLRYGNVGGTWKKYFLSCWASYFLARWHNYNVRQFIVLLGELLSCRATCLSYWAN